MASIHFNADDNDLDDAELWAVIDSAEASHSALKSNQRKSLLPRNSNLQNLNRVSDLSPSSRFSRNPRNGYIVEEDPKSPADGGEVLHESWMHRPQKMARYGAHNDNQQIVIRTPSSNYSSPDSGRFSVRQSPQIEARSPLELRPQGENNKENGQHSLSGRFPSVSLFKQYQSAAMAILEKCDYTVISGHPFIKKSGWRKISFFFNLSFEIRDKEIEFDQNRNVQRAEFVVRASMQGGRFSDGWGSCERREKRFLKPNNDIPSTAETRAKTKASSDLLGIGEYQPGSKQSQ